MAVKKQNSPIKFTTEELKSLEELQKEMDQIVLNMGQIGIQEVNVGLAKDRLKAHLENLKTKEAEIAKSLSDKYAKVTLDISSGEFTPVPDTTDSVKA